MKIFKELGLALAQEPLAPGVIKFTILVDPSSVIIPMYLHVVCLPGSREAISHYYDSLSLSEPCR